MFIQPMTGGVSLLDELKKGVVLKKVEKIEPDNKMRGKITKDETNYLKNTLAEAIKQRRMELTKNDNSESEKEDDDWSD
jgi:hypothetical protein